ncbi:MAG: sulfur oxidation c-type cytochrome SoxX [Pseudomonadota bacterium]|jgi:sulfur-oxidizing protein SoxX|uniref:Sulfur oxidation c-type cytochrome SoxX n=1 Tax=Thiothrix fructosivorans TaxID=111770 RepID=A0A8B0SPA7_9GAMM|nr:sulfur oxidation c-type cytochrome SoxX [Thiothrix fructosivorans]MBO0612101.1 sulfur oxidation c-type cytochrome SoxX [Thiothrix fructosivorans]QTX12400.1 sulfur oxidation c-type cytochrome SoxX [Thiothrix fructosivorans]
MRKLFRILFISASVSVLALSAGFSSAYAADDAKKADEAKATEAKPADAKPDAKAAEPKKEVTGKDLAFDRAMGNCLACHMIAGGELPGNIGPPLVGMAARFPDKAKLKAQIYDARVANPNTIMIPFGPMGILNDEQLDKVVDFISTL